MNTPNYPFSAGHGLGVYKRGAKLKARGVAILVQKLHLLHAGIGLTRPSYLLH